MSTDQTAHSAYRADIDGLRAVAVLSVLAGHAFPSVVPGGFIGVDVFFVISGFLISGIILGDLRSGHFSFSEFYSRRIRRIFPALALVLAFCLVVGWLILLPFDFRALGAHVAAGGSFVSNILLWRESGNYFDTDAKLKPLLHLWSLGVEEQYYLVWPLLLFWTRRSARATLLLIIGLGTVSFAINVAFVNLQPNATFYLPITRTWELMLGSLLAYFKLTGGNARAKLAGDAAEPARSTFLQSCLSWSGAGLILLALLVSNDRLAFPGWWALLPTLGATLLIAAGGDASINRRILSTGPAVFVGRISYPLYLWHWPLLTFNRILQGDEPTIQSRLTALAAAVGLAWATYQFVEKNIRHWRPATRPSGPVWVLICGIAALSLYGLLAYEGRAPARSASIPGLDAVSVAIHDWESIGNKQVPGNSAKTVLFFGDSHMHQYLPRIAWLARNHSKPIRTVQFWTRGGCAPIPGVDRRGYDCSKFVRAGFSRAERPEVDTVVFGASWMGFMYRTDSFTDNSNFDTPLDLQSAANLDRILEGFEAALRRLTSKGKRVVLVLSSPRGQSFDPTFMAERVGLGFRLHRTTPISRTVVQDENRVMDDRLRAIGRRLGIEVVDPLDSVCSASACPTLDDRGNPLYKDSTHLRAAFVRQHFSALDGFLLLDETAADAQSTP